MKLTVVVDGISFEVVSVRWLYRRWKTGGGKQFEVRDADGKLLAYATVESHNP